MLRIIISRYALFIIMGVEALLLPYFLSKEVYGEVEFYRYTAFLFQFLLLGSGTGYTVRALTGQSGTSALFGNFLFCGTVHAGLIATFITFTYSVVLGLLSFFVMVSFVIESLLKTQERYLVAMLFKPVISTFLIVMLPLSYTVEIRAPWYVLVSFFISFSIMCCLLYVYYPKHVEPLSSLGWVRENVALYIENIKSGFLMNFSTAMIFVFFYVDRWIIKEEYPQLLADYSFSFAVTQIAVVAISTFSYVNIVEFAKVDTSANYDLLKSQIFKTLKWCLSFYLVLGGASLIFVMLVEDIYGFKNAFGTTSIIMSLFGAASVALSVNSAHLYLKSINVMATLLVVSLVVSVIFSFTLRHESVDDYYVLLLKSYSIYFVFSLLSLSYIFLSLREGK